VLLVLVEPNRDHLREKGSGVIFVLGRVAVVRSV
jgi:hypothetical protein